MYLKTVCAASMRFEGAKVQKIWRTQTK